MARPSPIPALLAASLVAGAPASRAASDPSRAWATLETPHFAVHYYDDGEAFARRVATLAEEARSTLLPVLGHAPEERVHVACFDHVDDSNGFASVLPYPAITLFAHPPGMASELDAGSDWLRLLVFHEYAHVAHLDRSPGLPNVLNRIFGRVLKPNQVLPRWFVEGIAVWVESRFGGGGRVGSSRVEMILRTAALADRLPDLEDLTGPPLDQPRTMSWYFYGGYLVDHIARSAGGGAIEAFSRGYGSRLVPFALNLETRRASGFDLRRWFESLSTEIRSRAEATRARVEAEGRREGVRLTHGGESRTWPRFTPSGEHLLWIDADGHSPGRLVMAPAADPSRVAPILRCDGGCGRFSVTPDGRHVVMASARPWRQVHSYEELTRFPLEPDLPRGAAVRLTEAARAEDPILSPDGRRVWAVRTRWGRSWLESFDPRTGRALSRWDPPEDAREVRMGGPAPHPDGRRLYASLHFEGERDLVEIDLATGAFERVTRDAASDVDPVVTADGRWLVWSSDRTGVHDVYAKPLDAAGPTRKLTAVLGGAFQPAVSPGGETLVYSGWTFEGRELFAMPFEPESAPVSEPPEAPERLHPATAAPAPIPTTAAGAEGPRPYSPLATLLPRAWAPSISAATGSGTVYGLELSGADATGRLDAKLVAEWDSYRDDLSAFAHLGVGTSWPDVSLDLGRFTWDRSSRTADVKDPYREESVFGSVDVSVPLPAAITGLRVGAGYSVDVARAAEEVLRRPSPDQDTSFVPREGLSTSMRLFGSFDDVARHPWSISAARGARGDLSFRLRHPALASHATAWTLRGKVQVYAPVLVRLDHVFAVSLRAGISGGDPGEATAFSLGGPPSSELVTQLLEQTESGAAHLRGFGEGVLEGRSFELLTAEYRLPLLRVRRGVDTLPVFARDLSLALFSDAGHASSAGAPVWELSRARFGLGAELRTTVDLAYQFAASLRLGYARGLGPDGLDQVYLLLASDP